MSTPPLTLGIDLGTSSVKAVLTEGLSVLGRGSEPVNLSVRQEGQVEQNLAEIWAAVQSAVREATADHEASRVQAIGVSSQGGALQILDANDQPVGPVIGWMDGRGKPWDDALTASKGAEWFKSHTGHGSSGLTLGQLKRLRETADLPEKFRVGFVGDCIVGKLCGRRAHDASSLCLTLLGNPHTGAPDEEVLSLVGIEKDQLPDTLLASESAGALTKDAAACLGLPAGIPVTPAVLDQYAAAVACGAVQAGDVMFGAGTAWVLLAVRDQPGLPTILSSYDGLHPIGGLHGQLLSMVNGGSAMRWALELLNHSRMDSDLIASMTPGADGLMFWPLLLSGAVAPCDGEVTGRLDGLRLTHTPTHILRAVKEGLAFELKRHLDLFSDNGTMVSRLVMAGPASTGSVTPQIVASVTGVPVHCVEELDVSALGAAILGHSLIEGVEGLEYSMAQVNREVQPGPEQEFYRTQYQTYVERFA